MEPLASSASAQPPASVSRSSGWSLNGARTSTAIAKSSPKSCNWPESNFPPTPIRSWRRSRRSWEKSCCWGSAAPRRRKMTVKRPSKGWNFGRSASSRFAIACSPLKAFRRSPSWAVCSSSIKSSPPRARLAAQNVTLQELTDAAEQANVIAGGGIMERQASEALIRISGQSLDLDDIEQTPILWRTPRPVLIRDVADVRFGGPIRRGDGSVWTRTKDNVVGGPSVIIAIQKQPHADTLDLDARIEDVLDQLQQDLPADVRIERHIFKQADFIKAAIHNVSEAVRDGALWVVVILFLFMWNFRVSISSLTAMPLSILLTVLVFYWFGVTINTMTLGGIAVAIGDLVDDSIVDIENIYRRLKENRRKHRPDNALKVIFLASAEVRNSIVYATLIVALVVMPLFFLSGLEGRMFAPLGVAYIVSLLCSLLVSLTVTPVLGSFLLPNAKFLDEREDPFLLRWLKRGFERILRVTLRHAHAVLAVVAVLVTASMISIFWMGGEFLPPFNEGTLTITVQTEPGTSLTESNRVARRAEEMILEVPEVLSVSRRTGRAELDEHAEGVNSSEIDVRLEEYSRPKPGLAYAALRLIPVAHLWGFEHVGRPRDEVLNDIRERITSLPSVRLNIGQPISHRLDHIMSGVRAQIAVKVFGPDLQELRTAAQDVQTAMSQIPGVVDLQIEPQVEISQLRLRVNHREAARYGLTPGDVAELLETAYKGRTVSQVLDEDRYFDLVVWYDEQSRNDPSQINQTILDTPSGRKVSLGQVATVEETTGPNTLNRENAQRRIVVFCNVEGRDLAGVVRDIRLSLDDAEKRLADLPGSYRIEYGGQFEAQQQANTRLLVLGAFPSSACSSCYTRLSNLGKRLLRSWPTSPWLRWGPSSPCCWSIGHPPRPWPPPIGGSGPRSGSKPPASRWRIGSVSSR